MAKKKMGRDAGKNWEINDRVKRAHSNSAFNGKSISTEQFESLGDQANGVRKKIGANSWPSPMEASKETGKSMKDAKFLKHSCKGK